MKRKTTSLICGFLPAVAAPRFYRIPANCQRFGKHLAISPICGQLARACDVLNRHHDPIDACLSLPSRLAALVSATSHPVPSLNPCPINRRVIVRCAATDHRINVAVEIRDCATRRPSANSSIASMPPTWSSTSPRMRSELPPGVDGRLTFLSATGGFRYVVVHVNSSCRAAPGLADRSRTAARARDRRHRRDLSTRWPASRVARYVMHARSPGFAQPVHRERTTHFDRAAEPRWRTAGSCGRC